MRKIWRKFKLILIRIFLWLEYEDDEPKLGK
jgi:hypothetical protein